ncbi:AAA family ATPase [Archangium violaceum]|uniref:AAA family ATPase n=1 Tax=Archangium violaceum TaxID=83451 RepID=UPI000949A012|nr:AAA domain-containing protein [Archangium violaceum]
MTNESAQARHARKPASQAPQSPAPTPEPADLIVRSVLPEDLLVALESERSLYRWVMLKGAEDVRLEDESMLGLTPQPAADASWGGGQLIGFLPDERKFVGEIVHVDPTNGRVFLSTRSLSHIPPEVLSAERWAFQPYDFSEALLAASRAYDSRGPRVREALDRVRGTIPDDGAGPSPGPEDLWEKPWALLWGPPGTGKTETVARLLAQAIQRNPKERILAVAPTNRAADTLALRVARMLSKAGALHAPDTTCRIFRGGIGVGPELTNAFPAVLQDSRYQKQAARIEYMEERVRREYLEGAPPSRLATVKAELRKVRDGLTDETLFVAREGHATLMVLTVHRALRLVSELEGAERFDRLVVDEAGMVSRAAVGLLAPMARKVLLGGDPKQIGPVSRALEGVERPVQTWMRGSPLSHLEDAKAAVESSHVLLLRTQHRMHPQIGSVVSHFSYAGMLEDGEGPRTRQPKTVDVYPAARACWVVLDEATRDARRVCHERGESGRGYRRPFSAELLVALAAPALKAGLKVLAVTPYRAQAALLRALAQQKGWSESRFQASTIHRQQGTEYDVVVVDTVAAGRPFPPSELTPMLNVAASRAREYLFVLSSRAESEAAIPSQLLELLTPVAPSLEPRFSLQPLLVMPGVRARVAKRPEGLGQEIDSLRGMGPLFTQEQVALFERRFDEGHHLVRGVAGSGKTYVLAQWVARYLAEHPDARVLVSFFNKALTPLLSRLLVAAMRQRLGKRAPLMTQRVTLMHMTGTGSFAPESFDAVFVDEAQDLSAPELAHLYSLARPLSRGEGPPLKAFLLFADDSQNVYGNSSVEALRKELPDLDFTGRVRVLHEAFRSTRQVSELAFNVVLDPLGLHRVANPGMREFMRAHELREQGLLEEPVPGVDGLYRLQATEREGVLPVVKVFDSAQAEEAWLVREVKRLSQEEGVQPSDVLVVAPVRPARLAEALEREGLKAVAFGGRSGQDVSGFSVGKVDYIRVTTAFSCKGHESPVVFFCGVDALDDMSWLETKPGRTERELERTRRALFYVGATRAMVRQYVSGLAGARFTRTSLAYARALARGVR